MKKFINDNMTWIVLILVISVGFIFYKGFKSQTTELPEAGTKGNVEE